jgi:carbamoylphosphate synthase large subunit
VTSLGPLTLLLLSGGGHTGSNVVASLSGRRNALRLVATSDSPEEPALFNFDAAYLAPRLAADAAGFEQRVLELIDRESPDLVIPCRDEDVQWLAGLGERRSDLAAKFLCGPSAVAAMANDKWHSHEFCRAHALPFAPTLRCDPAVDAAVFVKEQGLPLVAKPRQGVAGTGIALLTTRDQVARAMARPGYVLQKYLGDPALVFAYLHAVEQEGVPLFHSFQGDKRSLQVLLGPSQGIEYVICTRNRMTSNIARSVTMDANPAAREIADRCARVFAAAGWRGPINIQCQPAPDGTLMIHEFNVRYTGATAARWELGHDEIGAAIRAFTGQDIGSAPTFRESPSTALESLAARAADGYGMRVLAQSGEWSRSRT